MRAVVVAVVSSIACVVCSRWALQIVAIDFFTVTTVRFEILFVLVVLAHDRRRVRHFGITAHPTAAWTAQQLVEAFPWEPRADAYVSPGLWRVVLREGRRTGVGAGVRVRRPAGGERRERGVGCLPVTRPSKGPSR